MALTLIVTYYVVTEVVKNIRPPLLLVRMRPHSWYTPLRVLTLRLLVALGSLLSTEHLLVVVKLIRPLTVVTRTLCRRCLSLAAKEPRPPSTLNVWLTLTCRFASVWLTRKEVCRATTLLTTLRCLVSPL